MNCDEAAFVAKFCDSESLEERAVSVLPWRMQTKQGAHIGCVSLQVEHSRPLWSFSQGLAQASHDLPAHTEAHGPLPFLAAMIVEISVSVAGMCSSRFASTSATSPMPADVPATPAGDTLLSETAQNSVRPTTAARAP